MTFVWFVIWLIANNVGGNEPLLLDPVNVWAGALILAVALDLSAAHATRGDDRRAWSPRSRRTGRSATDAPGASTT